MPEFVMFTEYHCPRSDGWLVVHHRCSGNEHIWPCGVKGTLLNVNFLTDQPRYSHCHRIHNPIVLLSIELPICNMQWKKSAQSESAVLLTTVGEDN